MDSFIPSAKGPLWPLVKAPSSVRSNNTRCLQQVSNEEHVSLEAFFQNPMGQDAMVQAMEVCAR